MTLKGVDSYFKRLDTFRNWNGKVSANLLARAGFYSTGNSDQTVCFVCKQEFSGWNEDEDPWLVHYVKNSDCPYVVLNSKAIQNAKDRVQIKNHLKSSMVEELVQSGKYTAIDVKQALEFYLFEFGIVPQTLNGIIYVTNKYLNIKEF